ncbi:hypothetical protein NM208_g614 [Fusarium decemcellulare]|uniref:Uncharacterized protein n=1 Tax=Fusarium decemcellulare TaxID=57161 RepID=A0ACC1SZA2_9HYPO|nr:hypothetical protein NM208_g614 [Fusarium decemcellulare]
MTSRYQALNPLRLSKHKINLNLHFRPYHSAVARFTAIDPNGVPSSKETGIMIGDPTENYVYIEPDIGNTIKSAVIRQLGSGVVSGLGTLPLQFHHDSRHFAHPSLPLPRLNIPQNLGPLGSNTSPATLWLSGNWHAITLDGTSDGQYWKPSALLNTSN